jgi:hypothetical protein
MLRNYINRRENHINSHPEFNIQEEHKFTFNDIINWVKIVANIKKEKGEIFRILEVGTKRSQNDRPTHKKDAFNCIDNLEYVMSDYQNGIDVDVVCDLHNTYDIDTAMDLEKRFISSIKNGNPRKFKSGVDRIIESKKK